MAMANPIDCQLKGLCRLSLKDICLRRVAVLLCNGPVKDIFPISTIYVYEGKKASRLQAFERIVSKLGLPDLMMEPLINITNFVFLETIEWCKFHVEFLKSNRLEFNYMEYMKHMHWTSMGSVDDRKTAEAIVRDENLYAYKRFKFACLYCFEEDIQNLWQKLSPQSKINFYNNGRPPSRKSPRGIFVFWTCILKGRMNELQNFLVRCNGRHSSIYQYAFEYFASQGYETGSRYFFEKLTCGERDASLVKMAKVVAGSYKLESPAYNNTLCYLLSQMNAEQFQNVLESSYYAILRIFMDWPKQDAFPEVANLVKPYLTEDDYEQLYFYLSEKLRYVYNSPKLFRDLFLSTPKEFRRSTYFLRDFFKRKDTEAIQFMFSNMDRKEILEVVLNGITFHNCCKLAKKGEWDFLEYFFRASRLSKEDRGRFLVLFNSCAPLLLGPEISERFTKSVNNISASTSKRDFSTCNRGDPMDSEASGQPDEELTEKPAKKPKKI